MKHQRAVFALLLIFFVEASAQNCSSSLDRTSSISLDPSNWDPQVLEQLYELENNYTLRPEAHSNDHIVTASSEAIAVYAGNYCLQQGGNAFDCGIVTSLTEIVLAGGSYISFAGIAMGVLYDATTNQTVALNGGWNVVRGNDPHEISCPSVFGSDPKKRSPLGQLIQVPGFMAAMQSLADCHGSLPWATLFQPAIYFANGMNLTSSLARWINQHQSTLNLTESGRRTFSNPNNVPWKKSDWLVQLDLSNLLTRVTLNGAAEMYTGNFSQNFIEISQKFGGNVVEQDLADYQIFWQSPQTNFYKNRKNRNFAISNHPLPAFSGMIVSEKFNLIQLFQDDVNHRDWDWTDYVSSGKVLGAILWIEQYSSTINGLALLGDDILSKVSDRFREFTGKFVDFSGEARASMKTAETVYSVFSMKNGSEILREIFQPFVAAGNPAGHHSSGVVTRDASGNVLSLMHTINALPFGTGLVVDGIALSNAACNNKYQSILAGKGGRVTDNTQPQIIFDVDTDTDTLTPVAASSVISTGLSQANFVKTLLTMNADGDGNPYWNAKKISEATEVLFPAGANMTLCRHGNVNAIGCHFPKNATLAEGDYSDQVLKEVLELYGIGVNIVPRNASGNHGANEIGKNWAGLRGMWIGATFGIDTDGSDLYSLSAATVPLLNGLALPIPGFIN
eukprot:TRINITY_DN7524_c0_g1_i1.p1 TRINITY_DN7524_c0_g1~~TRINITY_DN7524_c0_g1_i1.p1  ORF type:complete len:685 (+),score=185.79 TRINITY_DN7524_c0_g1_i1:25-2055(+)